MLKVLRGNINFVVEILYVNYASTISYMMLHHMQPQFL